MTYQIEYLTKQGDWVRDRSLARTYKSLKAAKFATDFFVVREGWRIVRVGSNIPTLHHDLMVRRGQ